MVYWIALPLFTILLALVGIAGAIIHLIRETGRK